jgi:hypothetical protein
MQLAGAWNRKRPISMVLDDRASVVVTSSTPAGRGRSRKRSSYYSSLASYHNKFLNLLTHEYQAEVR